MSKEKWKEIVKQKITNIAFQELSEASKTMTKLKALNYKEFKIQKYICSLSPELARLAFKIRTGMIDIRVNFKN